MAAPFERLLRFAAWSGILLLATLSLLPADDMVRTGADGRLEHFLAYAGVGAVAALAYGRPAAWRLAAGFAAYAALLEIGQNFSPGRHPALLDAAASALGAAVGISLARTMTRRAAIRRGTIRRGARARRGSA